MSKRTVPMVLSRIFLCGHNFPLFKDQNCSSQTATKQMAQTLAAKSLITPSVQPDTSSAGMCPYDWAARPLPDESAVLENALKNEGVHFISVRAEDFGENCFDATPKVEVRFSPIETDLHISVGVDNLDEKKLIGNIAYSIIKTILEIPQGTFMDQAQAV